MENINLESKYFRIEFKHNLINSLIICSVVLLLFLGFLVYTFFLYHDQFFSDYRTLLVRDFQQQMNDVNGIPPESRNDRISLLVKEFSKTRYVISAWVINSQGQLITPSTEKGMEQYSFLQNHLWQFSPDGSVIPWVQEKKENDFLEVFFPVYNSQNKIEYIVSLKMQKAFSRFIFIPKINKYVNVKYALAISLAVFLLLFANILIILSSLLFNKRNALLKQDLLSKLNAYNLESLPFRFNFEEGRFRNNFIASFIAYLNHLIETFHEKQKEAGARQDQMKQVMTPMIFPGTEKREEIRVFVKPDSSELARSVWELYFKDEAMRAIPGYSTGLFHSYKENCSDIVFRFSDVDQNIKTFFSARVMEADRDKKIVLYSLLHYILANRKENITKSDGFLSFANSLINRLGPGDFLTHASYTVLNLETDYVEVASTKFSPLILYKASSSEFSYYTFDSMALGSRMSDEFLKELKKQAFQLSSGDILVLADHAVEDLFNPDGDRFEVYRLSETIKENAGASAEAIADRIKEKLMQFSIDFSKANNLFFLVIKKS